MSKPKHFEAQIPRVYRASTIDAMLYAYTLGVLHTDPKISVTDALLQFLRQMNLADELDVEHARQIYWRFNQAFRENGGV